jgi:hypothetical protein
VQQSSWAAGSMKGHLLNNNLLQGSEAERLTSEIQDM